MQAWEPARGRAVPWACWYEGRPFVQGGRFRPDEGDVILYARKFSIMGHEAAEGVRVFGDELNMKAAFPVAGLDLRLEGTDRVGSQGSGVYTVSVVSEFLKIADSIKKISRRMPTNVRLEERRTFILPIHLIQGKAPTLHLIDPVYDDEGFRIDLKDELVHPGKLPVGNDGKHHVFFSVEIPGFHVQQGGAAVDALRQQAVDGLMPAADDLDLHFGAAEQKDLVESDGVYHDQQDPIEEGVNIGAHHLKGEDDAVAQIDGGGYIDIFLLFQDQRRNVHASRGGACAHDDAEPRADEHAGIKHRRKALFHDDARQPQSLQDPQQKGIKERAEHGGQSELLSQYSCSKKEHGHIEHTDEDADRVKALLTADTIEKLGSLNKTGEMLHGLITHYNDGNDQGRPMHDVNTIFYLLHPEAFTTKDMWVDIQTDGPAIGATVGDIRAAYHDGKTNAKVCLDIDAEYFNKWFLEEVSKMK